MEPCYHMTPPSFNIIQGPFTIERFEMLGNISKIFVPY